MQNAPDKAGKTNSTFPWYPIDRQYFTKKNMLNRSFIGKLITLNEKKNDINWLKSRNVLLYTDKLSFDKTLALFIEHTNSKEKKHHFVNSIFCLIVTRDADKP